MSFQEAQICPKEALNASNINQCFTSDRTIGDFFGIINPFAYYFRENGMSKNRLDAALSFYKSIKITREKHIL